MSKANNLVIVESPSKAKTISRYLGPGYTVKASMGHLRDLPKSKMGVDLENGFTPQYIAVRGKESLIKELKARWQFNKKKNGDPEKVEGTYYLRGLNRKFALEHNLPTAYNRLALMAVSVYHLSHWRLDVTVCNYILAV